MSSPRWLLPLGFLASMTATACHPSRPADIPPVCQVAVMTTLDGQEVGGSVRDGVLRSVERAGFIVLADELTRKNYGVRNLGANARLDDAEVPTIVERFDVRGVVTADVRQTGDSSYRIETTIRHPWGVPVEAFIDTRGSRSAAYAEGRRFLSNTRPKDLCRELARL